MFEKILSTGVGVVLLCSLSAAPAQAAGVKPLRLAHYTVSVEAPPETPGVGCDSGSRLNCGFVSVDLTFSGLNGRARPSTPTAGPVIDLLGQVDVTRVYGCADSTGARLARYDTKVRETLPLNTRRSGGLYLPATGDTATGTTYAFLPDAQPRNCPAGTSARVYSIVARHAKVDLVSRVPSIASKVYSAAAKARWQGAAPTPIAEAVPVGTKA